MGSSMSDPATFKQKNKEKHFQAYQRKYPDELISPQKIKLKQVKSLGNILHSQTIETKNQMIREQKKFQSDMVLNDYQNQILQNQQGSNKNDLSNKKVVFNSQNPVENQQTQKKSAQKLIKSDKQLLKKVSFSNFQSNKSSFRKITLNNQTYEVDIEKMKSRRLKNKQRYANSILSSFQSQNVTPKNLNGISYVNGISSLGLQSQLNSLKSKKSYQNSHQKQNNSIQESDQLQENQKYSDEKDKSEKNNKTTNIQRTTHNPIISFYSERKT